MRKTLTILLLCAGTLPLTLAQADEARSLEISVLSALGPYPDSASYYLKLLKELPEPGPDHELRTGYLEAAILNRTGKGREALKRIKEVDALTTQDRALRSQMKNVLGRICHDNDEHDAALKAYHEALEYAGSEDTLRIAVTYNNLGRLYERLKNYPKAFEALEKSIALHESRGDSSRASVSLLNIGVVYYAQKLYPEAEDRLERGLAYAKSAGMADVESIALETIGNVFRATNRFEKARAYYEDALAISERLNSLEGMASVNRNIGELFLARQEPLKAIPYLNKCLALADSMGSRNYRMDGHYYLSEAYERSSGSELALQHMKMFVAIKDSIMSDERNNAIASWQVRFETAEKERTILEQQMKSEQDQQMLEEREQQLWFLVTGIGVALIILVLLWRDRSRTKKLSEARIAALEQEQKLTAMRSVLEGEEKERQRVAAELHDGLGVLLSAARMRIGSDMPDGRAKADELLKNATTEVRRISHAMMPGSLAKLGLPEALQELADHLSGSGSINVDLHIHGFRQRLPKEIETGVYRMVQEALNNALRHGHAKNATIELSVEDGRHLSLLITDDGSGFEVVKIGANGHGLDNIRTRAALLGGIATIRSIPGEGTTWEVDIPIPVLEQA